jgi:hypothetical protein
MQGSKFPFRCAISLLSLDRASFRLCYVGFYFLSHCFSITSTKFLVWSPRRSLTFKAHCGERGFLKWEQSWRIYTVYDGA